MGRTRKPARVTLDGDKVRQLRERAKLSQAELAEICGFGGHSIISKIESGHRPELETAVILADALGIAVDNLVKRHYIPDKIGEASEDYEKKRQLFDEIVDNLQNLPVEQLRIIAETTEFQLHKHRLKTLEDTNEE